MSDPDFGARLRYLLRLWFGFRERVGRRSYVATGLGLAALKYLTDSALVLHLYGRAWTPIEWLSPLWSSRFSAIGDERGLLLLGAWSVPFVWIGASMTARRAHDAGYSAALALLFFVPGLNYLVIALLAVAAPGRLAGSVEDGAPAAMRLDSDLVRAVAVAPIPGVLALVVALATDAGGAYAYGLFLAAPFGMGLLSALVYNRERHHGFLASAAVVQLGLLVTAGVLLLGGLEGAVCLAMAYPLAGAMAFIGGAVGQMRVFDRQRATARAALVLVLTPALPAVDAALPEPPLREVVTAIEIDAAPAEVWPHLVAFSELPPPAHWIFAAGIAYPMRARIEGRGVGAVRYCEFSTGPFVEPITRWDEPERLSFDVVAQPPTMEEWSPYRDLSPPHVTSSLRSRRGEFRLLELPDGRTRLEGSTWYQIDLYPQLYWGLWSDALIHRIHRRVLDHVEDLSRRGDPR